MVDLRPAAPGDGDAIVALRDQLARWQIAAGIEQWQPGELNVVPIERQVRAGQWFLHTDPARDRGSDGWLVATARVLGEDAHTWGDAGADGTAGYLHGLMVHRNHAGNGLGSAIVAWFERYVASSGRSIARLDCVATNARLAGYYRAHGYQERGVQDFGDSSQWRPVLRFEKHLLTLD